ncbi:MAG: CBS domain-containing protein [Dehalococcoidia bacterium]|nr:CBS domain-containing protein [Dehalococcoidia bacterium]
MFGFVSSVLAEKGRQVYTIGKGVTVSQAVREMNEKGIGALVVTESGHPIGMFTERDVLRRVVDADKDPAMTRVSSVMTRNIVAIAPTDRVEEVMALMTERRMRHLPVVEGGQLIGMISIGDLMRWITLHQEDQIRHMTEYITGQQT